MSTGGSGKVGAAYDSRVTVSPDRARPGENEMGVTTALLVGVFFLLALGYVLGQAAGYALFVERFGAADLPVALLLMPIVGVALTTASLRVGRRSGMARLLLGQTAAMVGLAVGVRLGLLGGGSTVVRFLLPMWDAAINSLSNLVVWSAASRLFDVRQAKRLAPIVAAGRSAALIVGGAATPAIVSAVGTRNLYALQAVTFGAALLALGVLVRRTRHTLDRRVLQRGAESGRVRLSSHSRRYVASVFAVVLLSMTTYVLVRTVFLDRGAAALPDPVDYAGRIGVVSSAQGAVTLLVGALLGGRFLRRFGVLGGAIALPTVAIAAYMPLVSFDLALDSQLVIASVAYVVASAAMYGARTPTIQVLYQPLPDVERAQAVSIGEGIIEPMGLGVAALVLLFVTRGVEWGARGMGAAIVVVALTLVVVGIVTGRRYPPALERALEHRWLRRSTAVLEDGASRRWLVDEAMRGGVDEVAEIIGLLDPDESNTATFVERLAEHADRDVRIFLLRWLLDSTSPTSADLVRRLANDDPSDDVRALAARLGARSGDIDGARLALGDGDAAVRVAALVGLLESDSAAAAKLADDRITEWCADPTSFRREAAAALAVAGAARHAHLVVELIDDPQVVIRSDALVAAGRAASPTLVAPVIAAVCTGDRALTTRAVAALGALGESALGALDAAMARHDDVDVRRRLGRAIGRIDGVAGDASRRRLLGDRDAGVRARAADDLRGRGVRLEPDEVELLVQAEVDRAGAVLAARFTERVDAYATAGALDLLEMSLDDSLDETRRQLLRLLALDRRTIVTTNVIMGLDSHDQRRRAYAIEVLDTSLPSSLKALVSPLLNPTAGEATLLRRTIGVRTDGVRPADPLTIIAEGSDPWLARIAEHVGRPTDHDGGSMRPLIERVLLLRRVDAFAELPTEMLVGVAELLVEVDLDDGETLFHEGDPGSAMYVVEEGAIRIHHGPVELDRLSRHDVFGELSLLDSEPRSATVTADGPCRLLRLDSEPFFELVGDHPEVYRGILRKLVRRVRALTLMIEPTTS